MPKPTADGRLRRQPEVTPMALVNDLLQVGVVNLAFDSEGRSYTGARGRSCNLGS
jgi:hypothetical protein